MIGERKLFELGFRNAYLTSKKKKRGSYDELSLLFPFADIDYVNEVGQYIYLRCFFQNETLKESFKKRNVITAEQLENSTLNYNEKVMGEFLGFPPAAIEDYVSDIQDDERALIEYHGLCFVMKKENMERSLRHIKKHMPIPTPIANEFNSKINLYYYCTKINDYTLLIKKEKSYISAIKNLFSFA